MRNRRDSLADPVLKQDSQLFVLKNANKHILNNLNNFKRHMYVKRR